MAKEQNKSSNLFVLLYWQPTHPVPVSQLALIMIIHWTECSAFLSGLAVLCKYSEFIITFCLQPVCSTQHRLQHSISCTTAQIDGIRQRRKLRNGNKAVTGASWLPAPLTSCCGTATGGEQTVSPHNTLLLSLTYICGHHRVPNEESVTCTSSCSAAVPAAGPSIAASASSPLLTGNDVSSSSWRSCEALCTT